MPVQPDKTLWVIDPVHTKISFTTRYLLLTRISGWFTEMEGVVYASDADFGDAQAQLTIYVRSIATGNRERDRHLRSADFFNVKRYPVITFESTAVVVDGTFLNMSGILKIKDAVLITQFTATYTGIAHDPQGNTKAGFELKTSFNRKDLHLDWNMYFGHSGVLLANEVKVFCDVQLLRLPHSK